MANSSNSTPPSSGAFNARAYRADVLRQVMEREEHNRISFLLETLVREAELRHNVNVKLAALTPPTVIDEDNS